MEQLLNKKKRAFQDYCKSYFMHLGVLNRKLLSQIYDMCSISLVGTWEGGGGGGGVGK